MANSLGRDWFQSRRGERLRPSLRCRGESGQVRLLRAPTRPRRPMATLRRRLEVLVPANNHADDLTAAVRHALETTRATAACPFHWDVIIRVGDDAAETHAFERARKIIRSDGTAWASEALREEFRRQLSEAAD